MILTRRLVAAGIVAFFAAVPSIARAQTVTWVLCTPGSFKSCHSVALTTTPRMTGSVRTGTNVTFTIANLQGTHAMDNVAWSGINEINFSGGASLPLGSIGAFTTFALNGGATGAGVFQYFDGTGSTTSVTIFNATGTGRIGGCGTVPITGATPLGASFHTCGATASVSFSTVTSGIFDANIFSYAIIDVDTPNGHVRCVSDPAFVAPRPVTVACDDGSTPVAAVPEPMTIALLGTGLAGIGVARRRRKEQNDA